MDYTVHGILQARTLEWVALPFSRGSSQPRDRTQISCIAGGFFTSWATREALETKENLQQIGVAYSNASSTKCVCPSPSADMDFTMWNLELQI